MLEIEKTIRKHFPRCRILVFGSRLSKIHKKYSDIDISIDCAKKIDTSKLLDLKDELMESMIPIIVDICDFNSVSEEFRKIILENYEILD